MYVCIMIEYLIVVDQQRIGEELCERFQILKTKFGISINETVM